MLKKITNATTIASGTCLSSSLLKYSHAAGLNGHSVKIQSILRFSGKAQKVGALKRSTFPWAAFLPNFPSLLVGKRATRAQSVSIQTYASQID